MKKKLVVLIIVGLMSVGAITYAASQVNTPNIDKSNTYLQEAIVLNSKGDIKNSEIKLREAIKLNNKNAEAYYALGKLVHTDKDLKKALEYTTKAIQINPNVDYYYVQRAFINSELIKTKEALEDASKAIELNPKNADAYAIRGTLKQYWNYSEEALEDFNNAIKYADKTNEKIIYLGRATTYKQLHNFDAAIADYKALLDIAKAKNDEKAISFYKRGIEELESGKKAFK